MSENPTAPAESVTRILGLDHRRLDALLADAKRLLATGDVPRAAGRFAAFRSGLERHIVAEEEVLFPAFEALTGASAAGPIQVMRAEHVEIRRLLAEVSSALEAGGGERPTTPLAALTARLYAHNGKEERILYPATDRAARAADGLDALLRALRQACGLDESADPVSEPARRAAQVANPA
jgi:iron-sulfur cluster repair protein YtfE (RIC family)